jgi:predicted ATPase
MNGSVPTFDFTVKNYRAFADQEPLRLRLGPGFSAFVGPNNAGKSTLLRIFYEFREVFNLLRFPAKYERLLKYGEQFQPLGVTDRHEVFSNDNRRNLSIEVRILETQENHVHSFRIHIDEDQPDYWFFQLFVGPHQREVAALQFDQGKAHATLRDGELVDVNLAAYWQIVYFLGKSMYIGPFRNVALEAKGSHYDLSVGRQFIADWDTWKTGPSKEQNRLIQRVTEDIARIFHYNRLEINATADKADLQVVVEGQPYRLRELGAGLAEFIVVFGNAAINRPSLLLVDEPESHLHPSLQVDFLTSLASYAEDGVLFATHSLGLARSTADRIYSLRKSSEHTLVRLFEQTPNYAEFAGEMSFSAFRDLGHDLILLVEGVTEVKAIQQFLRALRKDHRVVVIPLGGRQFITSGRQHELSELLRLTKRVGVLIDSERTARSAALDSDRQAFVEECKALGFQVHVTKWRAFENYLTEAAIRAVKGSRYRALKPYELLKNLSPAWGKHENWRIAREMSQKEVLATDIGSFLDGL